MKRLPEPGVLLEEHRAPRLYELLREVAARAGTRPVDSIYLVPQVTFAVVERGSLWQRLRRRRERALVLGAALLDGLSEAELRALLAHEYARFGNGVAETAASGVLQDGLRHAVRRNAEFHRAAADEIDDAIRERRPLSSANLYGRYPRGVWALFADVPSLQHEMTDYFARAVEASCSEYRASRP